MSKVTTTDESTCNQNAQNLLANDETSRLKSSTDAAGMDKKINLNDFLDFLKLSCHVNDMISNTDLKKTITATATSPLKCHTIASTKQQKGQTTNAATNATTTAIVNFDQLANNALANELLGYNTDKAITTNSLSGSGSGSGAVGDSDVTDSANSSGTNTERGGRSTSRRRSSLGPSIPNYTRLTTKKPETPKHKGLHPKLNEQLDYVINEGVLDSVLPFICPVILPVSLNFSANRSKAKAKDATTTLNAVITAAAATTTTTISLTNTITTTTSKTGTIDAEQQVDRSSHNMETVAGETSTAPPMVKLKETTNKQAKFKTLLTTKDNKGDKRESEVVIHVCDEVKNSSRDFVCPQSLLVSKMGYFADVTAGQKLEDMDISVHCDIQIFDWLMKWVKCSANMEQNSATAAGGLMEAGPQLDANNVVPILVSASFLQMEPLLLDCLSFCHARLSDVVRTSTNLSCLNDSIVTRLAAMFTNLELEMVRDKKDRLTPRLWTKLIQSLCEPEPEALRGHFYSLSGLFRCARCNKCLTNTMKTYISCMPSNIRLNRWGQLVSYHVRDANWDINQYITQLFRELKSWRRVYWKLWGHCHFLYCCICEMHFPVYQMTWCRFHPESPNFLGPITEGRITGPAGRYPCCGQQAFRYETLPGPNGCQLREHSVLVETDRERAIFAIVQIVSENYALCETAPLKLQEIIRSGDIEPRWTGLTLTPQRCRQGLLPLLNPEESLSRLGRRVRPGVSRYLAESSTESENSFTQEDARQGRRLLFGGSSRDTSSSSDGCESESIETKIVYNKKGRKRRTEATGRYWCGELSARSNQDHQREFEEKVLKQVIAIVYKKIGYDQNQGQPTPPMGGVYVRLEADWKEQLRTRNYNSNNNLSSNNNILANNAVNINSARQQKK